MSIGKKIFSLVIAFLLTLLLCVWVLLGTALGTLYQSGFIHDHIDERYAASVYDSLMLQWETIGGPSGIPAEVMNSVIGKEYLAVEVQEYTYQVWSGNAAYSVNTAPVKEKLLTAFHEYAVMNGYIVDEETIAGLEAAADACVVSYTKHINIPALRSAGKLVSQTKHLAQLLFIALSVLLVAMAFLSVRIHHYWFHGTVDVVYTLLATALVLAPPSVIVLATDPMSRINLSPAYLRWLLSDAVDNVMWRLLIFAIATFVIGALLLTVSEIRHHRKFHRPRREAGKLLMANSEFYSRHRRRHHHHHERSETEEIPSAEKN